ncbi:acyltransferase family protein [Streptomyces sp. NPDC059743]|uniref:acyltransferase family protein n=1 Tax=Streptomyces sp. NPDC059743 TaxID=3346928 RepID=UPI003665B596
MVETTEPLGVTGPKNARLSTLTGMRGVAALLVFFFHISTSGLFHSAELNKDVQFVFGKAGGLGVSFFFVLSGFVLAWSARADDTKRRFWRRRFAKILPNHFVTWALVIALMLTTGMAPSPFETVPQLDDADSFLPSAASLLLIHAWLPDLTYSVAGNPVSWTLACEVLFYLSFPWLMRALSRIRPERLWGWALGTVAVIVALPAVVRATLSGGPPLAWDPTVSAWHHFAISFFPPARALEFVLGILMARIVLSGRWIRIGVLPASLLLLAGYVTALYVPFEYGLVAATVLPLALLIAASASGDVRERRNVFGGRIMVWIGEVSFAFYMVHISVIAYGHELIGGRERTWSTAGGLAIMVAFCLVSLLLAWALYTTVEMPAMRRFGRGGGGGGSARPPATGGRSDAGVAPPAPRSAADVSPASASSPVPPG